MNRPLLISLLILLAVLACGGWRQVRGSFAREAVHQVMRSVLK